MIILLEIIDFYTPGLRTARALLSMYIEEIVLEGFKSYATRTVIPAWDPQFNAITGLNGSGKSNILDAICFVLGIDNLKQVKCVTLLLLLLNVNLNLLRVGTCYQYARFDL